MSLPVVFRPESGAEFDEAVDWYESRQPGLGGEFIDRITEALDAIATTPELHRVIHKDVRRAIVSKFPYSVLYRAEPGRILVIAIFHNRRDPSVWKARN